MMHFEKKKKKKKAMLGNFDFCIIVWKGLIAIGIILSLEKM